MFATDYERGLLGATLRDESCLELISTLLQPKHFGLDSHQRIYAAMLALHSRRQRVDVQTLIDELGGYQACQSVGGVTAIVGLEEGMARFGDRTIETYSDRIRKAWKAREVARLGEEMGLQASDEAQDVDSVISGTQERLEAILADCPVENATADSMADEVMEGWEQERSLSDSPAIGFGIYSLDDAIGGMFPGHQVVVGARSGVGKTRFMMTATASVCVRGLPVQMNLIEPTRAEFLRGLACIAAGLRASVASEPWTAKGDERDRFRKGMEMVRKWPLTIYDRANMTLDEIIARGRVAIHHGCRLIGVDYLQRVNVTSAERGEQMRLKIARASTALANLVKDTQCTSLVLSQLKRTESMGIPTMQDLRESGQIENDAHTIILLHREYDSERGIFGNSGAYVVPKRRFGAPSNRPAYFDPLMATWEDKPNV